MGAVVNPVFRFRIVIHERIVGSSDERRIQKVHVVADKTVPNVEPDQPSAARPDDRSGAQIQEGSGLRPCGITALGDRPDGKAQLLRGPLTE